MGGWRGTFSLCPAVLTSVHFVFGTVDLTEDLSGFQSSVAVRSSPAEGSSLVCETWTQLLWRADSVTWLPQELPVLVRAVGGGLCSRGYTLRGTTSLMFPSDERGLGDALVELIQLNF